MTEQQELTAEQETQIEHKIDTEGISRSLAERAVLGISLFPDIPSKRKRSLHRRNGRHEGPSGSDISRSFANADAIENPMSDETRQEIMKSEGYRHFQEAKQLLAEERLKQRLEQSTSEAEARAVRRIYDTKQAALASVVSSHDRASDV